MLMPNTTGLSPFESCKVAAQHVLDGGYVIGIDMTLEVLEKTEFRQVYLDEFRVAGFPVAVILRTSRNARTKNPHVLAAEVYARR